MHSLVQFYEFFLKNQDLFKITIDYLFKNYIILFIINNYYTMAENLTKENLFSDFFIPFSGKTKLETAKEILELTDEEDDFFRMIYIMSKDNFGGKGFIEDINILMFEKFLKLTNDKQKIELLLDVIFTNNYSDKLFKKIFDTWDKTGEYIAPIYVYLNKKIDTFRRFILTVPEKTIEKLDNALLEEDKRINFLAYKHEAKYAFGDFKWFKQNAKFDTKDNPLKAFFLATFKNIELTKEDEMFFSKMVKDFNDGKETVQNDVIDYILKQPSEKKDKFIEAFSYDIHEEFKPSEYFSINSILYDKKFNVREIRYSIVQHQKDIGKYTKILKDREGTRDDSTYLY